MVLALFVAPASVLAPPDLQRWRAVVGLTLCLVAVLLRLFARQIRSSDARPPCPDRTLVERGCRALLHHRPRWRDPLSQRRGGKSVSAPGARRWQAFWPILRQFPGRCFTGCRNRARTRGAAREDIVTRRGQTRLSVHRIAEEEFLWRLEEMLDRAAPGRGAEALSLPMLIANKAGVVLFMNEAMRRLIGSRPRTLDRIFVGTDLRSGEETMVSTQDGQVRAILAEVEGAGERRELYLLRSRIAASAIRCAPISTACPSPSPCWRRAGGWSPRTRPRASFWGWPKGRPCA